MRDDDIDTLIDEVAKAMTSSTSTSTPGAPVGDDFARRVSVRIADAGERRQPWLRPWVLVPLATACVLALAVMVVRRGDVTTKDQTVRLKADTTAATTGAATDAITGAATDATTNATTNAASAAATNAATGAAAAPVKATGRPRARGPESGAPEIPAAGTIASIDVDAIDMQPLVEMNVIPIAPIAIDRIDIAAMP